MASNNEYEHRAEWDRKCERLLCDVVRQNKSSNVVNARIVISGGELVVQFWNVGGKYLEGEHDKIVALRNFVDKLMFNWEREYQKRFVPDGREGYKLPDYEKENEEYVRMLRERYKDLG